MENQLDNFQLPVNTDKVIEKVIDIYLDIMHFNTAEVIAVGTHLITLAQRNTTDVELMQSYLMWIMEERQDLTEAEDMPVQPEEDTILPF